MIEDSPHDYPVSEDSGFTVADNANDVTLSSVKERLAAKKPVSNEMISTAVSNLFSADSHDAYSQPTAEQSNSAPSLRGWLKKPSK